MLWFIIVTGLLIAGIIIARATSDSYKFEWLELLSVTVSVICGAALIIMIIVVGCTHIGAENEIAALNDQYEFLTYQVELGEYGQLDDISQYELLQDIYAWNKDVQYYKRWNDNPWTNWFIADYLTDYKVIDYSGIYK